MNLEQIHITEAVVISRWNCIVHEILMVQRWRSRRWKSTS